MHHEAKLLTTRRSHAAPRPRRTKTRRYHMQILTHQGVAVQIEKSRSHQQFKVITCLRASHWRPRLHVNGSCSHISLLYQACFFFFFLNTIWNFLDLSHTLSTGSPSPTLLLDHGVWIDLSEAIGKPRRWGLRTQSIYCPSASVSTSGLSIPQWPQAPQHTHSHTHTQSHT